MGVLGASLFFRFSQKAIDSFECLVTTSYKIEAIYHRIRSQVGIKVPENLCGRIIVHKHRTLYANHCDTGLGTEGS
jgi:hypothetical protein